MTLRQADVIIHGCHILKKLLWSGNYGWPPKILFLELFPNFVEIIQIRFKGIPNWVGRWFRFARLLKSTYTCTFRGNAWVTTLDESRIGHMQLRVHYAIRTTTPSSFDILPKYFGIVSEQCKKLFSDPSGRNNKSDYWFRKCSAPFSHWPDGIRNETLVTTFWEPDLLLLEWVFQTYFIHIYVCI